MKRILLLMILSCMAITGFAQGTYYWIGGTGSVTPISFVTNSNWNTALDGSGANRSGSANAADILIFDGSNVGGSVATQGTVNTTVGTTAFGQLILRNGASLILMKNAAGGTSTVTINGDGTAADDLQIAAGCNFTITSYQGDATGGLTITMAAAATGKIYGTTNILGGGSNLASSNSAGNAVFFESGAVCNVNTVQSGRYPLGSNNNKAMIFKSGSSLVYQGGNSFFTQTTANAPLVFEKGSKCIFEASVDAILSGTYNYYPYFFNSKSYADIVVRPSAGAPSVVVNVIGGTPTTVDNISIESGAKFNLLGSGIFPVTGNIVNNGTFGAAAPIGSSQLLMYGSSSPQSISGTGLFSDLGALSVGSDAVVTLGRSLNFVGVGTSNPSTSSISGTLNFLNNNVTGTGNFTFRPRTTITSSNATINNGSNVITFADETEFDNFNVALGVLITGTNIPANSYIVSTNTGNKQFTISNNATGNGGSISSVTKSHFITSSLGGAEGSVSVSGSKSFGAGLYYTFNAATTTPFLASSGNALGDVIFNAAATTNRNATINGKLTLNNAILTVREGDNLSLSNASINAGAFNASSYIVTNAVGGSTGVLKIADVSSSTLVPVGTAGHYTPVTLNPTSISNFEINVFQGATTDATSNGTALTAAQKLRMVDAVWNIKRTSGTGDVDVTLGWDNALEGASFAGFGNAQIGIAAYTSGAYGTFTGTGNAATNTATITTSAFSPFVVGEANTTLPLRLLSFTAKESLNSVKLAWQTTDEVNLKEYVLQHRGANGFEKIYSVAANNKAGIFNYDYTHLNPTEGVNYYRLVGIDQDGTEHPSEAKSVRVALGNAVAVYPNPVTQNNISVAGTVNGDVIKIINIQGQVMLTKQVSGNQLQEINVQHIQAGTYILSIENAEKVTSTKKVIKI